MDKNRVSGICEETAFAGFFRTHAKVLQNYLFYKFGNEEQASDVVQETFIKLWENCSSVPLEKAKSYIYTIANNTSLNHIAHQKVVLKYAQINSQNAFGESPDFILEEQEFGQKLQNAIANLTEAQRSAFLLNRIDGKKYAEIADIMGISVKAVEKRISGALVALRKEIANLK